MKRKISIFVLVFFMMLSIIPGTSICARAEEQKDLDLIMVLDQSESMTRNDPNGMMREAAKMLTEMMPARASRIGVISFNRKQTKVSDLTEVSREEDVVKITDQIGSIEYKGNTDIGNAVADAVEMFDKEDDRIHAILVFSDGKNYFRMDKNAEQQSDERLYDSRVEAEKQNCQIYCLGFGEEMADTQGEGYQKLLNIASSKDKVSTEIDPVKIHEFFVKMLADLTGGVPMPITNGDIEIESNVKEANIYLSSAQDFSNVEIKLTDPSGNAISLENNEALHFYRSAYSAVIKLFNPEPGTYKIVVSANDVEISVGYLPAYEYVLSSAIIDQNGNAITQINNQSTAEIQTVIQQNGQNVTDKKVYDRAASTAVVTAQDTGETQNIDLVYKEDGFLHGNLKFDHVAVYTVEVSVKADSFDLKNTLEIETNQRGIELKGELPKQKLNKTFKKSVDMKIDRAELMSVIENPDQIDVKISEVNSSNEKKVHAELTEEGILLTGLKWGSAKVDVTYKDILGNQKQSSFNVKVADYFLVALFAALPVVIALIVVLCVYLVMRQSRMIKGTIEIAQVSVTKEENTRLLSTTRQSYNPRNFLGRKKTLGTGMTKYAQDVYAMDSMRPENKDLFKMFNEKQSEIRQILDEVKFIGTYLGMNGCIVKVKKGAPISVSNNKNYRKPVKLAWRSKVPFKIYAQDSNGQEFCIEGTYTNSVKRRNQTKKTGNTSTTVNNITQESDEDFF